MQVRLSSARMQPYESRAYECVARAESRRRRRVNPKTTRRVTVLRIFPTQNRFAKHPYS
jgi:hypothetical protein